MPTDQERLIVSLEARIRDFERNMLKASRTGSKAFDDLEARAKKSASRMEQAMSGAASRVGTALKGFGAGFLGGLTAGGLSGIVSEIGKVAKSVAEVGDQAKRAGLSVKAFQELRFVAQQNRIDVGAMTDGLKELQNRADEFITNGGGPAAEAFQRLGYTAGELAEKLKDPSALFSEIIGEIAKLDKAAQIRVMDELFGGTGGEQFLQLLDKGEAGMRELIQAAHETGAVMDAELIAKAAELDRRFNALTTTVGNGLKTAIVEAASALQGFLDKLQSMPGFITQDRADAAVANIAEAKAVNDLQAQRSTVLRDIERTEAAIRNARDLGFSTAEAEAQLKADQARLFGIERQIEAQRRLNAEKLKTIELDGGAARGPLSSAGGRTRYRQFGEVDLPGTAPAPDRRPLDDYFIGEPDAASTGQTMAAAFLREFERFRGDAYWDVNAWRTGFGSDTTTRADGSIERVTKSTVVSLADAERDLARRIGEFQATIRGQIGGDVFGSFSAEQQAALTSIAYNYGDLPDRIVNAILKGGDVAGAIRGLGGDNSGINRNRRDREAAIFEGLPGSTPAPPPVTYDLEPADPLASYRPDPWAGLRQATDAAVMQNSRLAASYQQIGQIGITAFQGIASALADGEITAQEMLSIIGQLIQQLLQMQTMPPVPAAGAAPGGGAGIFGSLLSAIFGGGLGFASGGPVRGPGTGTSDSIPARLSNGEFVVNAAATRRNRALLEAINRGAVPGFANGGMVGKPLAAPMIGNTGNTFVSSPNISVKVEGGSTGDPEKDRAFAERIAKAVDERVNQKMVNFSHEQMRPGGMFTSGSRRMG